MAKNLVNRTSAAERRQIPVRRDHQWFCAQRDALPAKLEEQKQQKLAAVQKRLNRRLLGAAFAACDKEAFAAARLEKKLRAYDVRQYRKIREVQHGCAKAIFAAIAAGKPWHEQLSLQDARLAALAGKRAAYLSGLEKQKAAFVAKHSHSDDTRYQQLRKKLSEIYAAEEVRLSQYYDKRLERANAALTRKIAGCEAKMQAIQSSVRNKITLPDDVLLRVEGLKMYFGGLRAVDDLTFDVKKGEIFGLIGPNGAGKTTVFNCITRFYDATDGNMFFVNNQDEVVDLRSFQVHDVIVQGITRTFQNVELVKEISVMDNLLIACTREHRSGLVAQFLGLPSLRREEKLLREKAQRILKFMGLENYAAWYAMGLPYGVLKKVEIARALMGNPKLIIMDEPAAGLNDSETAELTRTIRRIRDEFGVTILLVEHDMSLVMNVCDTVCAISFGKMLAIGTCEQIKKDKGVQEAYLGVEEDA